MPLGKHDKRSDLYSRYSERQVAIQRDYGQVAETQSKMAAAKKANAKRRKNERNAANKRKRAGAAAGAAADVDGVDATDTTTAATAPIATDDVTVGPAGVSAALQQDVGTDE